MIGLRISELRKKKGVTQKDVANFLGVTNKTYSAYETGRNQMSYEMLCKLTDYFDVSTDYLLGRCENMPSFLSESERELVDCYRTLDERGKKSVQNNMSFEVNQSKSVRT